jgi:hypothetical protein
LFAINIFIVEEVDREWNPEKLATLKAKAQQLSLFQTEAEVKQYTPPPYFLSFFFGRSCSKCVDLILI